MSLNDFKEAGGRRIMLRSLVGSHNYNLNTEDSDKDYKAFVIPSFDDLYDNERFKQASVTKNEDIFVHDIRVLANLLYKSNINFIEVLFSIESEHDSAIEFLFEYRDEIARMNLPYLYNACKGMCWEKLKAMPKGTEGTAHLVEQYGYDTKNGLHAFRVLDFCYRFANNGFKDFKQAITYGQYDREWLLEVKHGKYDYETMVYLVNEKLNDEFRSLAEVYGAERVNEPLNEFIHNEIKKVVKNNINLN